jgi:DNA-binding beta-propeller fold protein YncE
LASGVACVRDGLRKAATACATRQARTSLFISWSRFVESSNQCRDAYLLTTTSSPRESTVIPVDLATGTAGKMIDVGRNASRLMISPNGATVFVLDSGAYVGVGSPHNTPGRVVPIATSTGTVGKAIKVGLAPAAFAIALTGQKQ